MAVHTIITCPECNTDNCHQYWDEHTKKVNQYPIEEDSTFLSSKAGKEEHAKFESSFNCPTCNNIIPGVRLINDGEVRV